MAQPTNAYLAGPRKHVVPQRKATIRRLLHAFGPWRSVVSGRSSGPKAWHLWRIRCQAGWCRFCWAEVLPQHPRHRRRRSICPLSDLVDGV